MEKSQHKLLICKIFIIVFSIAVVVADILMVGHNDDFATTRCLFWSLIIVLEIYNVKIKNIISNIILLLYQLFLSVCTSICIIFYVFAHGSWLQEIAIMLVDSPILAIIINPFVLGVIAIVVYKKINNGNKSSVSSD